MRKIGRRVRAKRRQRRSGWSTRGVASGTSAAHVRWRRRLEAQWQVLSASSADHASHVRLVHLRHRLQSDSRGVVESAVAELELAALLSNQGYRVIFLPESRARTADFECRLADEQFFVEVTAMVGSRRGRPSPPPPLELEEHDAVDVLIQRILARVSQKAKQLRDYCAPVLLAITLPPGERDEHWFQGRRPSAGSVDEVVELSRLAGALTVGLGMVPHLSGVLLSVWDKVPAPQRSTVRLANAHIVERSLRQREFPPIRLLVLNPVAAYRLANSIVESLKAVL